METVFRHLHMPYELACEFFAVFSRMEYALKATRFPAGNDRHVYADWEAFANEANRQFHSSMSKELKDAVAYLRDAPPKKQMLNEMHQVRFVDFPHEEHRCELDQLLLMVRCVRNNLFHGGKHLPDGEKVPGRNEVLVKHALTIIKVCISILPDVKESYER